MKSIIPFLLAAIFVLPFSSHAGEFDWEAIEKERAEHEEKYNYFSPKGEFYKIWLDLPDSEFSCTDSELNGRYDYFPGGIRSFYCHLKSRMSLDKLEKISGHKVFLSGPHKDGQLSLYSKNEFGHYNKDFVKWMIENAIPGSSDKAFRVFTQNIYDSLISNTARVHYLTYILKSNDFDYDTSSIGKYFSRDFVETFYEFSPNIYWRAWEFWERRDTDGTDEVFLEGLQKMFKAYDKQFLVSVDESISLITLLKIARNVNKPFQADDLNKLNKGDLRKLRNSIFATYGYKFEDMDLQKWFYENIKFFCRDNRCGQLNYEFSPQLLTPTDKENVNLISSIEQDSQ